MHLCDDRLLVDVYVFNTRMFKMINTIARFLLLLLLSFISCKNFVFAKLCNDSLSLCVFFSAKKKHASKKNDSIFCTLLKFSWSCVAPEFLSDEYYMRSGCKWLCSKL